MAAAARTWMPIWAGVECTVNRVGDRYFDQLIRSGHAGRIDDLDRLAELGVRTLRYPVLWERTAPGPIADADWRWADARLDRLRSLAVEPIVGLVHHGSGPAFTSLVDDAFPDLLARYAGAVASRYPWVTAYTPINEPLTTARFAGLYGNWYPHGRSDRTFVRALLVQARATVLAMRAIRAVAPAARLVTTEDLGAVHAVPALAYQAEFENERRWLSNDLVGGRVDRRHPLWHWLVAAGAPPRELEWLVANPCPADVVGCNYYVTSERFLDDEVAAWPAETHGGNGRARYADVAAVRACEPLGPGALLAECHARFGAPVAITEVHLGCTREEQLRWLVYIVGEATAARAAGVPVLGVTAWAAFGSYDWCSLVTRDEGHYEPGLFDVRSGTPRPTALAAVVRALAHGRRPAHPVLAGRGWWERARIPEDAAD